MADPPRLALGYRPSQGRALSLELWIYGKFGVTNGIRTRPSTFTESRARTDYTLATVKRVWPVKIH